MEFVPEKLNNETFETLAVSDASFCLHSMGDMIKNIRVMPNIQFTFIIIELT